LQRYRLDVPNVMVFPPLLLAATIGLGLALNFFLPARFLSHWIATPLGSLVTLAAIAIAISAAREMVSANTPLDVRKPATELVTSGAFRISRNPIYLGMFLLCAGLAFLVNSLWLLVLALQLAFVLQKAVIEPEEAYLEQKFGKAYLSYKAKVRRWI
jgi:protein-S-isoprenylcysteine O-methyltransferase Ste14